MEDLNKALESLKKCKEIDPNVNEVNELYTKLENDISKYKSDEKKVFKSFFRVSITFLFKLRK